MAWNEPCDTRIYRNNLEDGAEFPAFELVEKLNTNDTAFVVRDTANGIYCLQSYSTIVSMAVGGQDIRLGHWSRTTAKHQSMFSSWVSAHC